MAPVIGIAWYAARQQPGRRRPATATSTHARPRSPAGLETHLEPVRRPARLRQRRGAAESGEIDFDNPRAVAQLRAGSSRRRTAGRSATWSFRSTGEPMRFIRADRSARPEHTRECSALAADTHVRVRAGDGRNPEWAEPVWSYRRRRAHPAPHRTDQGPRRIQRDSSPRRSGPPICRAFLKEFELVRRAHSRSSWPAATSVLAHPSSRQRSRAAREQRDRRQRSRLSVR